MITLAIAHLSDTGVETDLLIYFIKVPIDTANLIVGVYGDLTEIEGDTEDLILRVLEFLEVQYNSDTDNLRITEVPDADEIKIYTH